MTGYITITPSTLERGMHWDEWEDVIRDLEDAGYGVHVLNQEETRSRVPTPPPEFYIVATLVWQMVGKPATEAIREVVKEQVRGFLLARLKPRKGKPQIVVIVDEHGRPISEVELPRRSEGDSK